MEEVQASQTLKKNPRKSWCDTVAQHQRILSLPLCVEVTLLIMPQNPVCLFWSSPRWYICLRVIAILDKDVFESKCVEVTELRAELPVTHLFFLLTIMSIVCRRRLSSARISASVTFLVKVMKRFYFNFIFFKIHKCIICLKSKV